MLNFIKEKSDVKEKLNELDVGLKEDAIFGLQNLVAVENHAQSSFFITQDKKFLELNDIIRKIRTRLLEKVVKKDNSEIWCISKHLLASYMSLTEIANRYYSMGDKTQAEEMEKDAGTIMGLILVLNEIKGGEK